jgi:hypothetical protein
MAPPLRAINPATLRETARQVTRLAAGRLAALEA